MRDDETTAADRGSECNDLLGPVAEARKRFEAWMRSNNPDNSDVLWRDADFPECYHYGGTEAAWQSWAAAEAAERERWASSTHHCTIKCAQCGHKNYFTRAE